MDNNDNSSLTLSVQSIDFKAYQELFERLDKTIHHCQYRQVVHEATSAINQLFESHLLVLFDIRAHANAMQGHYDAACSDVRKMIKCAPGLTAGYARKGMICSISGRHTRAIKAFDEGLQKITATTADDREEIKREEKQQLVAKKEKSIAMNNVAIDFLSILPNEIINEIIVQFPQETKMACLGVSQIWRRRVLECASTWKRLSFKKSSFMDMDQWLINITPYIGSFVENLTIDCTSQQTLFACLEHINSGYFSKVQSLKMPANSTCNFRPSSIDTTLFTAFSQMNDTLTYLNMDLGNNKDTITLANIVQLCTNLTDLQFTNTPRLSTVVGDFSGVEYHGALVNLELKSFSITGQDIELVLQKCRSIRRLVMTGCNTSVLDPINMYATNLEILGYNPSFQIPGLDEKKKDWKMNGLRMIYCNDGGPCVPTASLFPLIYKNRNTLEVVYAILSDLAQDQIQQFTTAYADFRLDHATSVAFWLFPSIQSFLLRSIRHSTALARLHVTNVHDVDAFTQTLMDMPPLRKLSISHVHNNNNNNEDDNDSTSATIGTTTPTNSSSSTTTTTGATVDTESDHSTSLIRLLSRYAKISRLDQPSLESIKLRYWDVNDSVLTTLADIKTLRMITLAGLNHVTTQGIQNLIKLLSEQEQPQLSGIKLNRMKAVTNDVIIGLGDIKGIATIELDELHRITDKGIKSLIDNPNHRISKLKVKRCRFIGNKCLRYIKQKIKS
ncbi:hypothetical protein BDA99DRAFT_507852 [Phascolomyces articulosus]|uniref:F-box domain-containing protein n=1 Tax=Phascolomyces articulosus TaxID=60185 RepID=A0AAD5KG12_9FUNG|nr:hypothetical protein BDA99DRAFT_507852 [Phascolomyces articulosus]